MSISVHFLVVLSIKKWTIKKLDRIRRSLLCKEEENANATIVYVEKGSNANRWHYLVMWPKVTRLKNLGGLGILDLERFRMALRLRWL